MTDDKTPEFSGPVSGLTLTSPGPGKVIWPDGTDVSAEQFQDSVTAATIAFEKGLAAGRREAVIEELTAAAAEWDELEQRGHDPLSCADIAGNLRARIAVLRAEGPTSEETACPCVSPEVVEWKADRWWRAVGPDGSVWCESSNEAEVRERARPDDTIQRFYMTVPTGEWRNA